MIKNNRKFVQKTYYADKGKIKKVIDSLPEKITADELINRIILLDKIEKGLDDVEKENVYTTEEVEKKLNKWLI